SVVFTVDDGYGDFARMAAPVFARYDCPVTVFLTTGYLDRECWFWWDQVEYVITARPGSVELALDGISWASSWGGGAEAQAAAGNLVERLKQIPDDQKQLAITRLSDRLDVPIPSAVPAQYAPMSWDEVRSLHQRGVAFGPHTVNHPVLSRTPDRQSEFELRQSWQRLSAEIASPTPVFCYPNGTLDAFGSREMATLRSMGLLGAVTIAHDHLSLATVRDGGPDAKFLIPRFPCPESRAGLIQIVSGMEFVKSRIRRWVGRR
ncbi:MAG: polysaccharide deacetylase family protein, partial [Gemmatimonadota bacterium]